MKNEILASLFLASCYVPPLQCEQEQTSQTGTYFVEFEQTYGNCGPLAPDFIDIKNGIPFYEDISNCVLEKYEWSQQTCLSESSLYCGTAHEYVELDWLVVSNEQDLNVLDGILTIFKSRLSGVYTCESVHSFTAIK